MGLFIGSLKSKYALFFKIYLKILQIVLYKMLSLLTMSDCLESGQAVKSKLSTNDYNRINSTL